MASELNQAAPENARDKKTEVPVVVVRWRLLDVMKPNTLVGVFDNPDCAAKAIAAIDLRGLNIRLAETQGLEAARALRREWQSRSLLRRLLGFSDEERVVKDLARHLEAGRTLLAVRARRQ